MRLVNQEERNVKASVTSSSRASGSLTQSSVCVRGGSVVCVREGGGANVPANRCGIELSIRTSYNVDSTMLPHLCLRRMSMSMSRVGREPPPRITSGRSAIGVSSRRRRSVPRRARVACRSRRSGRGRRGGVGASESVVAVLRSTELETPHSGRFARSSSSSSLVVARSR